MTLESVGKNKIKVFIPRYESVTGVYKCDFTISDKFEMTSHYKDIRRDGTIVIYKRKQSEG